MNSITTSDDQHYYKPMTDAVNTYEINRWGFRVRLSSTILFFASVASSVLYTTIAVEATLWYWWVTAACHYALIATAFTGVVSGFTNSARLSAVYFTCLWLMVSLQWIATLCSAVTLVSETTTILHGIVLTIIATCITFALMLCAYAAKKHRNALVKSKYIIEDKNAKIYRTYTAIRATNPQLEKAALSQSSTPYGGNPSTSTKSTTEAPEPALNTDSSSLHSGSLVMDLSNEAAHAYEDDEEQQGLLKQQHPQSASYSTNTGVNSKPLLHSRSATVVNRANSGPLVEGGTYATLPNTGSW